MPSVKETVENNAVVFFLGAILAGFAAGYGTHSAVAGSPLFSAPATAGADWQTTATQKGWIDKNTCPALPVKLRILSPGDSTSIPFDGDSLRSDLVINASRPIPEADSVGFVMSAEGDSNFYVTFEYFKANEQRTVFRDENFVRVPVKFAKPTHVSLWAIMIDDKEKLGSIYGSLDQIKAVTNTIFLSDKIDITVVPKP